MARKAAVKYRSLRSNLVHLPLSLYASLAQSQTRPQSLILHLAPLVPASSSRRPPQPAYLGWSGLAAASSLSGIGGSQLETVEVDPEVALNYGWAEGTILEISLIHNPTKARSVSVTPLSADDWEILEQNANYLENNLLGQLRAAQKGQEIDVWVLGRTKIRIRVDATNPPTTSSSVVLVNADTEIYVAPRPRDMEKPKEAPKQIVAPAVPVRTDSNRSKTHAAKSATLRLVPSRVAIAWGQPHLDSDDSRVVGSDYVAWVSPRTLTQTRQRLGQDAGGPLFVNIRREKEVQEDKEGDEEPKREEGGEPQEEEEEPALPAWLVGWDQMPPGTATIGGEELDADWTSWGNISVTLAEPKRNPKANGVHSHSALVASTDVPPPLAGVESIIDDALSYLSRGALSGNGKPLLLTGGKGSGKTVIAKTIGERLEQDRNVVTELIYTDVGRLDPDARVTTTKDEMSKWIENAEKHSPCLLVLDNLDLLLGPEQENSATSNPSILAEHFSRLFSSKNLPPGVLVLVTTTGSASLHPLLTSKHIFGEQIKIPSPTSDKRREILAAVVKAQEQGVGSESELNYVTLSTLTEGYSASDLNDFVTGASQQAMIRCARDGSENPHLTMDDFVAAQEAFTPFNLRGVLLQKSEVRWEDIGGLHEARSILRETLEWPTKYAPIFAKCPLRLRSGLLLYGYPGCGKTLLASAVAKECGLNFISVKGPEILNKYIGASEQSVRDLFERASAAKPCVLFFDEFDSIAPKRGHDSTGVTDRVVNQMLTEMDGAQGLEGVYVLAATSRPDLIDPALLRPGRLDKSILCDMPPKMDRLEILQSLSRKLHLSPTVDLEQLAEDTEGFSGADLQALVYNAHLDVVHSVLNAPEEEEPKGKGKGKEKVDVKGKGKAVENGSASPAPPPEAAAPSYRQLQPEEAPTTSANRAAFAERIETIVTSTTQQSAEQEDEVKKEKMPTPVIEEHHLRQSLRNTRASVAPAERARFARIYHAFVSDRDNAAPNGEPGRDTGSRATLA